MSLIYLDNSATTALSAEVKAAMSAAMECYGNPSSLHTKGMDSAKLLASARADLARAAGLRLSDRWEVIFTGSGSEANNLAILGAARAKNHFDSKRILITDSEHPSVTNSARRLEAEGFETVLLPTVGGRIDLDALDRELARGAFLVSVMLVNNETGAYYDVAAVAEHTRRLCPTALLHCDAVQGFLRVPLPVGKFDMISVSAHKIHGPKGCGALLVSPDMMRRRVLSPVIYGGGQESGLRSGTENLICIAGFAAAAKAAYQSAAENAAAIDAPREHAERVITEAGARVNRPERAAGHILSVTLPSIKSQTMLNWLSSKGICVSSGSACSSHDRHVSPTLRAFGLSDREADCTIRVSLCPENTAEELDALGEALREGIEKLVKIK